MRAGGQVRATASAILPLAMLLVPKCPLCLLPLFVAAGLALPSPGLLNGLLATAAAAAVALLASATRSTTILALAISGSALLLGGRWLGLPLGGWAGAPLMMSAAIGAAAKKRSCERSCRAAAALDSGARRA